MTVDRDDSLESLQSIGSTPLLPPVPQSIDSHIWGFLQPYSPALKRVDLWKSLPVYDIGRTMEGNVIILPGLKISSKHARISWDGHTGGQATVILRDLSSNGTFINGVKIGKGRSRILRDGHELAFGCPLPQLGNGEQDYRRYRHVCALPFRLSKYTGFVFRLVTAGMASEGIHVHYDFGPQLGAGGFACVYKAIHRETGKWYAVKVIKAPRIQARSKKTALEACKATAFAREITIMGRLVHPNICQLKEAFISDSDNTINLVLELIDGGDLLDYIASRNGISESVAKGITSQICDAMAYVHSEGIAHRDLKPENILLTKDDPPIVKVADFGLAKAVDSLTAFRTLCGTSSYLAPEVVNQSENEGYTNLVDSWSVGVIVFSM
ncbi:hypothetical protein HWV62_799 [Athelia sp. TMB]|nr:hypothetical protein HWV62_799 [Athelia sp. TMB]